MSRPGKNRGVSNFKNKLTEQDVIFIYLDQDMTEQALAEKFNVGQSTINHIKRGRTWAWLTTTLDSNGVRKRSRK